MKRELISTKLITKTMREPFAQAFTVSATPIPREQRPITASTPDAVNIIRHEFREVGVSEE